MAPSDWQYNVLVIGNLLDILRVSGRRGRLYYQGFCKVPNDKEISPLPINISDVSTTQDWLQVKKLLLKDPHIKIEDEGPGLTRIRIQNVSSRVLGIRIGSLSLSERAQYDPLIAIGEILSSPDVRESLATANARPMLGLGGLVRTPMKGRPHLPQTLKDVTLDEAFDEILNVFRGLIVYGECTRSDGSTLFNVSYD